MTACVFCDIVAGERTAFVVWRDDRFSAFLDHTPLFPGHVLLVPNDHLETVEDLPPETSGAMLDAVARLSRAVRTATGAEGVFVAMNNIVSQSVPHAHFHVVPRNRGDGLRGFFWPRSRYEDDDHAERVRAAIAEALSSA